MRKSVQVGWSSLWVGILVVGAVAMVLYASMFGGGAAVFGNSDTFECYFKNVDGLVQGSPVWMSGMEVGHVSSIGFVMLDPKRNIRVECTVTKDVWDYITDGSYVTLGTIGFLGDKYVDIVPSYKEGDPIKTGAILPTSETQNVSELFKSGKEAFKEAGSVVSGIDTLLSRMNKGEGTLGKLATDDVLYVQLAQLSTELTKLVSGLQDNQERVINSVERLSTSVADLSDKVNENSGTLGRLVNDPQLYDNLTATSARLDTIMTKVDRAEGSLGLLVNDTTMYTEMTNLLTRANNLIDDIQKNPRKYLKFSVF